MSNSATETTYIMIEKIIGNSSAVVVKFSGIKECNITTKIYNPIVSLIDDTIFIINQNDHDDENEIQFDINNFEFNEYNSNNEKLVFNSELNFANSFSIQKVSMQ